MAGLKKLECLVVLACMIVAGSITAKASLSCGDVNSNLTPCIGYLTNGGISTPGPPCCNGVRKLNGMAFTTEDRREACRCIKYAARSVGIIYDRAAGIPGRCGVKIPYNIQIRTSTNCMTVR